MSSLYKLIRFISSKNCCAKQKFDFIISTLPKKIKLITTDFCTIFLLWDKPLQYSTVTSVVKPPQKGRPLHLEYFPSRVITPTIRVIHRNTLTRNRPDLIDANSPGNI